MPTESVTCIRLRVYKVEAVSYLYSLVLLQESIIMLLCHIVYSYLNLRASGSSRRPRWSIVETRSHGRSSQPARQSCTRTSSSQKDRWVGVGGWGGVGGWKTLILLRAPLPPCAEPPVYAVRVVRSSTKKLCTDPPPPPPLFRFLGG